MQVMVDFCVVPLGVGLSLSKYVAECERVLKAAGLTPHLHAFGTSVEGEWDEVMGAIRRCHEELHRLGAPRIHTTMRLGTRTDREQTLADKVESVKAKLKEPPQD